MGVGDDYAFPIDGTEFWMVRASPYVRGAQAEGFLVPTWFVAHVRNLDDHLHMLGHAPDPRVPYPPAEYEKAARSWIEENADHLRPPPPKLPPDPPSPA